MSKDSSKNGSEIKIETKLSQYILPISVIIFSEPYLFWLVLTIIGRYELRGNLALIVALIPLVLLPALYISARNTFQDLSLSSFDSQGITAKNGRRRLFRDADRFEIQFLGAFSLPRVYFPDYTFAPTLVLISQNPEITHAVLKFIDTSEKRGKIVGQLDAAFRMQRIKNFVWFSGFGCLAGVGGWFLAGPALGIVIAAVPIALAGVRFSKAPPEFTSILEQYKNGKVGRLFVLGRDK
jgi:hypothetical protein